MVTVRVEFSKDYTQGPALEKFSFLCEQKAKWQQKFIILSTVVQTAPQLVWLTFQMIN